MCLGIARALNDAHESILNRPAQAINSAADFKGMHVGYNDLWPVNIMFSGTSKSSEALFSTFYNITTFGLCDLDLTKSVARCRTEFMTGPMAASHAPEARVCREVSLSSDIWSLGLLFLQFITWFLHGWFRMYIRYSDLEKVEESVGGQPGVKLSSRYAAVSVNLEKGQAPCVSIAELTDRLIGNHTPL